jgi:hypothetical protein
MNRTLGSRSARVAFEWVIAYTCLVEGEVRERRRDEMLAHLWESERCRSSLLPRTIIGSVHDLVWCHDVRRQAGQPGLAAAAFIGETGGLVTSAAMLGLTVVVSLFVHQVPIVLPACAGAVFCVWVLAAIVRRCAHNSRTLSSY